MISALALVISVKVFFSCFTYPFTVLTKLGIIVIYNSLIRLRNIADTSWAQIDAQLKRRADLIPNLINTVKGYMKHEKQTLTELTKARTDIMKGKDVNKRLAASDQLSSALKTLFAVSENYPDLKANQNFMMLQEELSGTESKIAYARQAYNDSVLDLHNKLQTFPSNVIANLFGFKAKEYFKITEADKKNVKVDF